MSLKPPSAGSQDPPGAGPASIGLWDGVSIVIGIVIGVSIFKIPPLIFGNVSGPWQGLGAWLLGGLLCIAGALCYAELATTYPRMGGDYAYLTRAYGPWAGFLFGWARLVAIQAGSIGMMAYVFADYSAELFGQPGTQAVWFAAGVVVALTAINLFGLAVGKTAQNILTCAKVLGLLGILVAGLFWGKGGAFVASEPATGVNFGFAMILILYAYGGWNDAAFVAAEVRDRHRNMPRVLLLGTAGVMVIYLVINLAYLAGLGFDGLRGTRGAPAAEVLGLMLGPWGKRAMCVLVMLSALGAVNGMVLTGSRVPAAMGADHRILAALGRWHPRWRSPVWSLVVQAGLALLMVVGVGTAAGRGTLDSLLTHVGMRPVPWEKYYGGFDTLFAGTAGAFWFFFLLTGLSVFVLRWKDRGLERPFSVPLYPVVPLVFCLTCGYMLYCSLTYAKGLCLFAVVPLLVGVPLYGVSRWAGAERRASAYGVDQP